MSENSVTNAKVNTSQTTSRLGIEHIVRRILPYWPLAILVIILTYLSGFLYLRYIPKVYRVQSRVIVNDDDQEKSNSNLLRFQFEGTGVYNEVEKEIEILKSRGLISEVVKELSLSANVIQTGTVKTSDVYGKSCPFKVELFESELINETISGKVEYKDNGVTFNNSFYQFDSIYSSPFGKIKFTKKSSWPSEGEFSVILNPIDKVVSKIKSQLIVSPISPNSTIVDISIFDTQPERGIDILNTILQRYSVSYVGFKRRIAENTLNFVDDRLSIISSELNDVEKNLEKFKSNQRIVDLSAEGQIILTQLTDLDRQFTEIDVKLQVLNDVRKYVNLRNKEDVPIPATLGLDDPLLQTLLTQLFQAEFEQNRLEKISGSKNPQLLVLQDQVEKLKPSIQKSIDNLEQSLLRAKSGLLAASKQKESQLTKLPQKERLLLDISRQQSIKNTIFTFLLQKREEAAIQSASVVPNSRVIDDPINYGVEKPRAVVAYIMAWTFYSIIFVLVVFFREFANPKYLFKKELESELSIPIVGELVHLSGAELEGGIVVKNNKRDLINEQFRDLRTNINYLNKKLNSQSVLVTSSKSGEGKSFASVNLAISLANTGKRVVLVELDLRKPKVIQYLGLDRGIGISSYLSGSADMLDIIRNVQKIDNLSVIGAGPLPPNPAELILNDRLRLLFEYLQENFDFILIDAPPIGIVSDARLLGQYADTCLYLVRSNYTEKSFSDLILGLTDKAGMPPINIVFNGIALNRLSLYGYGYGYGYVYSNTQNYIYGENKDKKTFWSKISSFIKKS